MEFKITSCVHIKDQKIFLDKQCVFSEDRSVSFQEFLKLAYHGLEMSYPKFFKMDGLSKLGMIATDLLFQGREITDDTALIFTNSSSSIGTDELHQKAMNQNISPAIFVYTLPNIVMGEVCIKNKIYGENSFFITEKFDPAFVWEYAQSLLDSLVTTVIVCGWIEWNNAEYDVFLCLVTQEGEQTFSTQNLEALYNFENE